MTTSTYPKLVFYSILHGHGKLPGRIVEVRPRRRAYEVADGFAAMDEIVWRPATLDERKELRARSSSASSPKRTSTHRAGRSVLHAS